MKKLLSILTCVVLSLSMIFAIGCGGESAAFKGDYKEASKEEIALLAAEFDAVEDSSEVDFSKGVKMEFYSSTDVDGGIGDSGTLDMEMNFYSIYKESGLQMSGDMSMKYKGDNAPDDEKVEFYYKDGTSYVAVGDMKVATKVDSDDFIDDNFGEAFASLEELDDVIEEFLAYGNDAKYSIDKNEENIKVKFEYNGSIKQNQLGVSIDMDMETTYIFVFDAVTKKLIAYKAEVFADFTSTASGQSYSGKNATTLVIEPWQGEVELPSDLDTYLAA